MHIITAAEPFSIRGTAVEAGVPYLVANSMAGDLLTKRALVLCGDGMMRPLYRLIQATAQAERPIDPNQDYNGRDVWMFRMGGFGDVLMATPTIREIKRLWPGCRVHFVTMPEYAPVLKGVDCDVHTGFLPLSLVGPEDPLIFFEGVIEDNPLAREVHAVELLANRAGIALYSWSDFAISYHLDPEERAWAIKRFPPAGRRRIGIQAGASSGARSYEGSLLTRVIHSLRDAGTEVFLFGKKGQIEGEIEGVFNLSEQNLTFRESVAVLSTCNAALVPDSSLQHVAGAIGVPTVALFGSFPGDLRVIPGNTVEVLTGAGNCAPCFWHESGGARFPDGRPCSVAGFCTVLASIPPEEIVEACLKAASSGPVKETVVYDFLNHKIGDTVAAAYLLKVFKARNPEVDVRIVDRGAISVVSHFPQSFDSWASTMPVEWESIRRLNFEFGNLWIAAPSAFKDTKISPRMFVLDGQEDEYDIGIHCLSDADYNVGRNHDPRQFEELIEFLHG